MSLDLTRTSPELMIERINIDNELFGDDALTFAEVTMDLPFEVPPDADGRNCSVTLLSVPQVKYRADQTVYAKRFDAAEFFLSISSDPVRLKVMSAVTTRDLIARLNDLYHWLSCPMRYVMTPLTGPSGLTKAAVVPTISCSPNPTSLPAPYRCCSGMSIRCLISRWKTTSRSAGKTGAS